MGRPPGEGGIRGCLCRQSEISDTRTGWEEGSGILSDGRSAVPLGGCHHRRPPAEAFPSSSWASSPNLDGGICGASALGEPGGGAHEAGQPVKGSRRAGGRGRAATRSRAGAQRDGEGEQSRGRTGARQLRTHELRRGGREGRTTTKDRPPAGQPDAEGARRAGWEAAAPGPGMPPHRPRARGRRN